MKKKCLAHPLFGEPVYDDLVVPDGMLYTIGSLSGDARVGRRAKLVIKGACYGDVYIADYGSMSCESVSGDVKADNYATLVVGGACYGDVAIGDGGSFECQSVSGDIYAGRGAILVCKGSCYGDVVVGAGGSFRCQFLSGDVRIEPNANLICEGLLFGDAVIGKGGSLECKASISGNIKNEGGRYSISGSFHGDVSGECGSMPPVVRSSPVSRTTIVCPECGTINAEDASDCVACGNELRSVKKATQRQND